MSDRTLLRDCPYCGGNALYVGAYCSETSTGLVMWYHVECENPNCSAVGPVDLGQSGAVEKWNDRASQPACTWTRGEYEDTVWETSCSQLFILDDGTPADNDMKFCAYCGKPLVEAQPEPCEDVEL
jgi:hypothetical protein